MRPPSPGFGCRAVWPSVYQTGPLENTRDATRFANKDGGFGNRKDVCRRFSNRQVKSLMNSGGVRDVTIPNHGRDFHTAHRLILRNLKLPTAVAIGVFDVVSDGAR